MAWTRDDAAFARPMPSSSFQPPRRSRDTHVGAAVLSFTPQGVLLEHGTRAPGRRHDTSHTTKFLLGAARPHSHLEQRTAVCAAEYGTRLRGAPLPAYAPAACSSVAPRADAGGWA